MINFQLPNNINLQEFEIKMILAGELYQRQKLSLGQAANLVGITKREFIEKIGDFGYSIFGNNLENIVENFKL